MTERTTTEHLGVVISVGEYVILHWDDGMEREGVITSLEECEHRCRHCETGRGIRLGEDGSDMEWCLIPMVKVIKICATINSMVLL